MTNVKLYYGYINIHTIDANKHPDEQIKDLIQLIKNNPECDLEIHCNSPYVIFNITVIEGYSNMNVPHPENIKITNKHFEVLKDGSVVEGKYYKNMISDENLLNDKLEDSNVNYSKLLDLRDELDELEKL